MSDGGEDLLARRLERSRLIRLYRDEQKEWRASWEGQRFEDSRPCEVCGGRLTRTVFLKFDHYGCRDDGQRWLHAKPLDSSRRVYMKDARDGDDWYLPTEPIFEHRYIEVDGARQKTSRRYVGEVKELRLLDGHLVRRSRKRESTTTYEPTTRRKDMFSIPPERRAAWHAHGTWRPDLACILCGGCLNRLEDRKRHDWYQCGHCGIQWVQGSLGSARDRILDESALPGAIANAVGNLMPPVSFEALAEHLRENHGAYNLNDKLIRRGIKLALTTGQISIQPGILSKDGFPFYRHGTRELPKVSATIRLSDVSEDQRTGKKPWLVILRHQENEE